MKLGNLLLISIFVYSLFSISITSVIAINESEIILDPKDDVYTFEGFDLSETSETKYVTEHEDIDVQNIDIREVRYERNDKSVTFRLKVEGEIEDRGGIFDINDPDDLSLNVNNVAYEIALQTTDNGRLNDYAITYTNKTCQVITPNFDTINLTDDDFYINNKETLVINIELETDNETYETMEIAATFMKFNLLDIEMMPDDGDFSDLFSMS